MQIVGFMMRQLKLDYLWVLLMKVAMIAFQMFRLEAMCIALLLINIFPDHCLLLPLYLYLQGLIHKIKIKCPIHST